MSELSDLLQALKQSGQLESEGQFTLNLQQASRKLGLLQLPEPRAYILKLVQWAIRSRPSRVEVTVSGSSVSVWHDGERPDFVEMCRAESLLSAEGALGHLGVGINSALSLDPSSIRLESGDSFLQLHPFPELGELTKARATEGVSVVLEGLTWQLLERSKLVRESAARHWTVIPRIFSIVPDSLGFRRPEVALLRQRCLAANVPIFINGKSVLCPINSRSKSAYEFVRTDPGAANQNIRYLLARTATPGAIPCPPKLLGKQKTDWIDSLPDVETGRTLEPGEVVTWPQLTHLRFEGQPALPGHATYYKHPSGRPGTVSWVMDGVIVDETPIDGSVHVVADASDLKTDLSQFAMVTDESFQRRLEWLKRWVP